MKPRLVVIFLFMLVSIDLSWAADIENQIEEAEEETKDVSTCQSLKNVRKAIKALGNSFLEKLGTPKGVTLVACAYGMSQGISNFLWAFDWVGHAGLNDETSKMIQEIGGISSSVECILIGAIVPAMVYSYQRKHPSPKLDEPGIIILRN